jgi:molybdopterin/thiamine biosynthesis adenylyltransferase
MDRPDPLVLFPATVAARLDEWGASWGLLNLKIDHREGVVLISKFWKKDSMGLPYSSPWQERHYLRHADAVPLAGVWYRGHAELHDFHRSLRARGIGMPMAELRSRVGGGWTQPPVDRAMVVMVLSREDAGAQWSVWWLSDGLAFPARFAMVDDGLQPLDFIRDVWPVDELSRVLITVVGVGSIGGAAVEGLASNGIGGLALVDDDRLLQHNLARHRLTDSDLGRFKVHAMGDHLAQRYPGVEVESYPLDVITSADVMRPLFARSGAILCATDGVTSRRVVNHLARRAGVPVIFAAVLEDGAFGEVIRIRSRSGCLLCLRTWLEETETFDPEPGLDLDYGTGTLHRPMTASPADLSLVGELAAKAILATVLEARGRWSQRLPGDWAIVGLQPTPDMPAPFDIDRAGEVRWHPLPGRREDCPTCKPP